MIETLKKIAQQTGQAEAPAAVMYGEVCGISPLTVRVDARFNVGEGALVRMADQPALCAGDKVVLLRDHGGQSYVILGRL